MEPENRDLQPKNSIDILDEIQSEEGRFPDITVQSIAEIDSTPILDASIVKLQPKTTIIQKTCVRDVSSLRKAREEHCEMISVDLTSPEDSIFFFVKPAVDKDLKEICDELKQFQFLRFLEVNVGKTKITNDGVMYVNSVLVRLGNLKGLELDFSGTQITDDGVYALCVTLKALKSLTYLSLEFAWDDLSNSAAVSIAEMVKEMNNLTRFKLSLFKTGINKAGVLEIANKLAHLEGLKKVNMWLDKSLQQENQKIIEAKIKQRNPGCMVHIM